MMFPGVLGMFVAFGMMLVIQSLTADWEDDTLLRAKSTPGGVPSYLVSKFVTTSLTVGVYLLLVALPKSFLVDGLNTGSPAAWFTIAWVVGLGMIATQPLGAVRGPLVASPRAASYIALLVMALIAVLERQSEQDHLHDPGTEASDQTAASISGGTCRDHGCHARPLPRHGSTRRLVRTAVRRPYRH